jgi:hypothetical protein
MPRGELDRKEEAAGKIVAGQLGGTCEARDVPGAPDATHDLDVVLDDGSRVPVEVTSFGDRRIGCSGTRGRRRRSAGTGGSACPRVRRLVRVP